MNASLLRSLALTAAAAFAFGVLPAMAQNAAVVNNKPIPKAKLDAAVAEYVKQGQPDTPELREHLRDDLIKLELLMQQVDKEGLATRPDVQQQLERARQQVLIANLAQDYFKTHQPTEAEAKIQYDQYVANMGTKEYRAHHILVDSEAAAKSIIKKLKAGAKFEDLAKDSKDTGSAAKGGELDWAPPASYVPEFSAALVKLQKGQTTDTPVKTQYGFHVIRLDDIRDTKVAPFADVKDNLIKSMAENKQYQQAKFNEMLEALRASAKVE